jgi:PKD repeat protein
VNILTESSIHNPYLILGRVTSSALMRILSQLSVSPSVTVALTAAVVVAIDIILLASNITITNAQQQQQPLTSQPAVTQNGTTTLFQSIEDGIGLKVPQGWVIYDVNNTGAISEESTQGYGILAQLCPQEEEQQGGATFSNVSGNSGNTASCQGSEGDIIHIVRYPDLDTRLRASNNVTNTTNSNMTIDNILPYHMQKLQEVGYNRVEIVDNTDTTLNVTNAQTNEAIAIVPAKNVEITYSTDSAPNETRTGYFILTAANATAPFPGETKGYSIFYEGNSATTAETTPSGGLAPTPLPAPVRQVFDSFELVTAAGAAAPLQSSAAAAPPPIEPLTVEINSSDANGGGEVAPATFDFEANVTGGTEPYTYSWDFDEDSGGENNEQTVSHTFEEAGSYNVALTVTDSDGQNASDSIELTVEEAPDEEEEEQPAAEEEEEENNSGSFDVDEYINDLLDRIGFR